MGSEDFDLSKLNIGIIEDGTFRELGRNIDKEIIDVEVLDDSTFLHKNDGYFFEYLEPNSSITQRLLDIEKRHRGEIVYEVSSGGCDGSMYFAVQLYFALKRIGCTNIKIYSEDMENPIPAWAHTKFIATGIMWNTNNWRKLHGFPMMRKLCI